MKKNHRDIRKLAINLLVSILIGIIGTTIIAGVQYAKMGNTRGTQRLLGIDDVETVNMEKTENGYRLGEKESTITWDLDGSYISKFECYYSSLSYVEGTVEVYTYDVYGKPCVKEIKDALIAGMPRTVINIGGKVCKIVLHYNNTDDKNEAVISNALIDNNFKFNPYLVLFISAIFFLILFFVRCKELYVNKPELGFLICALTIGGFLVFISPAYTVGWDEEIHFQRAYEMGNLGSDEKYEMPAQFIQNTHVMFKLSASNITFEERIDAIKTMVSLTGRSSEMTSYYKPSLTWLTFISYVPQAVIFGVGGMLHIPFYILWVLGKLINLFIYSGVIYFAIKKIPVAKYLMCVIGLVPTAIFQATSYTYDCAIVAGSLFAVAVMVKGFLDQEECLSRKELAGFLAAMIVVCLSKAVYAPLFFVALFIPKSAYDSNRDCKIFRSLLIGLFLITMIIMILPNLISPSVEGDSRGGATSVSGQLESILRHPFSYAYVLLSNAGKNFMSFSVGGEAICILGHYGTIAYGIEILYAIFIFSVTITDTYYKDKGVILSENRKLDWKIKCIIIIAISIIIAFIWTALYLSFNEVGSMDIVGVQGRYFLPILLPALLLFQGDHIKNTMEKGKYQIIVMGGTCLLTMGIILKQVVLSSCL